MEKAARDPACVTCISATSRGLPCTTVQRFPVTGRASPGPDVANCKRRGVADSGSPLLANMPRCNTCSSIRVAMCYAELRARRQTTGQLMHRSDRRIRQWLTPCSPGPSHACTGSTTASNCSYHLLRPLCSSSLLSKLQLLPRNCIATGSRLAGIVRDEAHLPHIP